MQKTKEIVVDFSDKGSVAGMHFDDFDLGFLGRKHVTRASEIFHNSETQLWDVILPGHESVACTHASGFSTYNAAREFEVLWLQNCRMDSVAPDSDAGISIAAIARTVIDLKEYK